jgi:hypothetical protein
MQDRAIDVREAVDLRERLGDGLRAGWNAAKRYEEDN